MRREDTSRRLLACTKGFLASVARAFLAVPRTVRAHGRFYDWLATRFGPDFSWNFMNYGFDSDYFHEHPLPLISEDNADRLGIQLYDHLLSPLSIVASTILEVGCGRGGGASYIARYLRPRRAFGVDLCYRSVRICRANHQAPHLTFLTADAGRLPFRDGSFDVVVNVESSHAYARMLSFLDEVTRVLKPGGYFVFADMRWVPPPSASSVRGLPLLRSQLANCGLGLVREADLSAGVLQARASASANQRTAIRQNVPAGLRFVFRELAGLPGTTMYRALEEGSLVYWSAVLRKPPFQAR